MIGALPQTPEFIAFVFPKMGRKNRRQKSAAHFGVKSVQPLRSHSCVAVSCRTEKANYIINNCLEDYSIYTVCATLPSNCCSSLFDPATCKNNMRQNPAIFGLASEVPIDFNRVIFRSRNTSSDNNMVDHNLDCFTIKLLNIYILLNQFATIISGKNTFV